MVDFYFFLVLPDDDSCHPKKNQKIFSQPEAVPQCEKLH